MLQVLHIQVVLQHLCRLSVCAWGIRHGTVTAISTVVVQAASGTERRREHSPSSATAVLAWLQVGSRQPPQEDLGRQRGVDSAHASSASTVHYTRK